jgi:hypothetical protein
MAQESKKSKFDRLTGKMLSNPSEGKLLLSRNLSFGGAAACLVILSQIIQVGAKDEALEISVVGAAVGIPLWIAVGSIHEFFIALGKRSYPFLRKKGLQNAVGGVMFFAGCALFTAVGGAVWYLSQVAFWAFLATIFSSLAMIACFQWAIARWWYSENGPQPNDASDRDI